MITKDQLFVQGELVAEVADIRSAKTPLVEPLLAVLERPMVTGDVAATDPAAESREITVLGDKALPYDVVRKVMATCTAAAYGKISLAVVEKGKPVDAASPKAT